MARSIERQPPGSLSSRLVGQTGEFLVCAELGRLGYIATPFSGNVPGFDVIATNSEFRSVPIQVKATRTGSWHVGSAQEWLDIAIDGKRQSVRGDQPLFQPDLIYVFVSLAHGRVSDRFFILSRLETQAVVRRNYMDFLEKHGGIRPKQPDSLHCSISASDLDARGYRDRWRLLREQLGELEPSEQATLPF